MISNRVARELRLPSWKCLCHRALGYLGAATAFLPMQSFADPSVTTSPQVRIQTALRTDRTPQGWSDDIELEYLGRPLLNNRGQIAFAAAGYYRGTRVLDSGIWAGDPSNPELVFRLNQEVDGERWSPKTTLMDFNDAGQVAFDAGFHADFGTGFGVIVITDGLPRVAASSTTLIPGSDPNLRIARSHFSDLNNQGDVVFYATLRGPSTNLKTDSAYFATQGDNLIMFAREGDVIPGRTERFGDEGTINSPWAQLDDSGRVGFTHTILTGVEADSQDNALWFGTPNDFRVVAREGDPAPGLGTAFGHQVPYNENFNMNDDGDVVFYTLLEDIGAEALWLSSADTLQPLMLDTTLDTHFGQPNISNGGQVVFDVSQLIPESPFVWVRSLWSGPHEDLQMIFQDGMHAPGTEPSTVFDTHTRSGSYPINALGQVALHETLTGPGVHSTNDRGLWMTAPSGGLHLIAREGDLFELGGETKTIAGTLGIGLPAINDLGQVAFSLRFTDGTQGFFIATIPEPGSLVISLLSIAACVPFLIRRGRVS